MKHYSTVLAAVAFALAAGCVHTETAAPAAISLDAALQDYDLTATLAVAGDHHRSLSERALASAAIGSWQRQDERAGMILERAVNDATLTPALRRDANLLLSSLRLRQSRYGESLAALDAALPDVTDPARRADLEQGRTFIAALVGAPAMEVTVDAPGSVPLTRDVTNHMRAQVGVNGGTVDAIVDTGSGVSTLALSEARRLGVRMLTGQATIGTATADVTTGLAIADRVTFGGAEFRNVVFLVMPDEALTFANGAYVVKGIIGLPLLVPLGRVEYTKVGDGSAEILRYGPGHGRPDADSNLILDGVEAIALTHAEGATQTLRFFIDNGAPHTHLNRRFVADFPTIAASGRHEAVTVQGGGGNETQTDAMRLPSIVLHIGGGMVSIPDVPVTDDRNPWRHGAIGLDALEMGSGYVFDFDAMRLELLP